MAEVLLGAARLFASHYQFVVCDDPLITISDDWNWNSRKTSEGFAGGPRFRMIGTEADSNDHWIELVASDSPPNFAKWQRITCAHFHTSSGDIHVMSIIDGQPAISVHVEPGDYGLYIAGQNLGIDQRSLGKVDGFSDTDVTAAEWYRVFLVSGKPEKQGRLKDGVPPLGA
jgi:hypothetical protein